METKILNLDEIIATQPARVILWQGKEHPVVGMTGFAYLDFLRARKGLDKAQKENDEAAQWNQNLLIIGIIVPTLAVQRDELLKLKLPALTALTAFIMAEVQGEAGAGEARPGPTTG